MSLNFSESINLQALFSLCCETQEALFAVAVGQPRVLRPQVIWEHAWKHLREPHFAEVGNTACAKDHGVRKEGTAGHWPQLLPWPQGPSLGIGLAVPMEVACPECPAGEIRFSTDSSFV